MPEKEPPPSNPPFQFSEREKLVDLISHARLLALLADEPTHIHEVELSSNSYGEFLFITVSRPSGEQRTFYTLYGLGYHEYRERWVTDVWSWYRSERMSQLEATQLSREAVEQRLSERLAKIRPDGGTQRQSPRARLYEFLAELTDEDGAMSEMEDLEGLADWLFGDEDEPE